MCVFGIRRILPALLWLSIVPATAKCAPQIVFDSENFNWGTVYQGSEMSHTFTFRNRGEEILEISRVRTSCGCTVAKDWPKTVKPGEKGKITATLDTGRRRGFNQINVTVNSNDPRRPGVTLKLGGNIEQAVEFRPGPDVLFRGVDMGVETIRTMEVYPLADHRLEMEKIEHNLGFLEIRRERAENERGAKGYRIIVKLDRDTPPGTTGGYFIMKALLDGEHNLEMRGGVRATILGEVEVTPMRGFFGAGGPGSETRVFTLKRRHGGILRVKKVRSDRKEITGEVLGEPEGAEVKVKIAAEFPPSQGGGPILVGSIRILTDVRKQPEVEIPYTVRLRTPARPKPDPGQ